MKRLSFVTVITALAALMVVPAAAAQEPSNPAVVRDGNHWLLRDSLSAGSATTSFHFGRAGDTKLMCDWNGNGEATAGVVRVGTDGRPMWHLRNSNTTGNADQSFSYGRSGDRPICGDWNGDGVQTAGIVREDSAGRYTWHLRNAHSGGAADITFVYGRDLTPGTLPPTWPVAGDWNGDGTDTIGIVRGHPDGEMNWLLRDSNTGGVADHDFWYYADGVWGDHLELHIPVVGDWNGDGHDGPGVARASNAANPQWLLRNDRSAGNSDHNFRYGRHLDIILTW